MALEKNGRFLTTVGEQPPVILCEEHAKIFEIAMTVNDIPHTIYEFEDEDESQYCQACDLQVAKDYVKRVEEQESTPKIVLPGEY
jgi:hypothetical protein